MKERRDMNERAFAEKVNRKNKQHMDLMKQRKEFQQQSMDSRARIKYNKMQIEQSKRQSSQNVKNISKMTLDLKHRIEQERWIRNYERAQNQKRSETMLHHNMNQDRRNQENLNKFVYDMRVDNEM